MEAYSTFFFWKNIVAKMGVALSRSFGRSGLLDKIPKISLDHCLLNAKEIIQKFTAVFLQ